VVFLILIFFLKAKADYKNEAEDNVGLAYGELKIGDLISKDTDGDGVQDWEENLWGTDPTKSDTDGDGANDDVAISKLRIQNGGSAGAPNDEVLTETDKFSRELFATVATLSQAGPVDEKTIEKLSASLSEQIKNPKVKKVFLLNEIKTRGDNSAESFNLYIEQIAEIYKKYPVQGNVISILEEFSKDFERPNVEALEKLDPIIKHSEDTLEELARMEVPAELAVLHLDLLNSLQRLKENITDLQFFETDTIVAMSAMSKYEENVEILESVKVKLGQKISGKTNS